MVMPLAFSSLSLSVSMPVRALTSVVLPWSIWPAVPSMICFMATHKRLIPKMQDSEMQDSGSMIHDKRQENYGQDNARQCSDGNLCIAGRPFRHHGERCALSCILHPESCNLFS